MVVTVKGFSVVMARGITTLVTTPLTLSKQGCKSLKEKKI